MKRSIPLLMLLFVMLGCKKTIQDIKEDLVIKAMTDGQWTITNFTVNGAPITGDFAAYKFQYYSNKTVDAIKNGSVEKTGQWDGNAGAMTTWANFDAPPYPLSLINGTWNITRNSWTYVEAYQNVGSDTRVMRLDKL